MATSRSFISRGVEQAGEEGREEEEEEEMAVASLVIRSRSRLENDIWGEGCELSMQMLSLFLPPSPPPSLPPSLIPQSRVAPHLPKRRRRPIQALSQPVFI